MSSLTSCNNPTYFNRDHPELYVIATHSLLGVWGMWGDSILFLEEDSFGRIMFAYTGNSITSDNRTMDNILAILIAQKISNTYSYFYQGINFILHEIYGPPRGPTTPASDIFFNKCFVKNHFSSEQIEQLKLENSWNEKLNYDKFFRVFISRHRRTHYLTYISDESQKDAYLSVVDNARFIIGRDSIPLTMDKNGNIVYFIRGRYRDSEMRQLWIYYPAFLFMFDSNGILIEETGTMELTDLWNYRDQLREFKELNGWSFTYR